MIRVKLGDICTVVSGSTPKTGIPEYWDGEIKWITPAELSEDSYYLYDSVRHITEEGRVKTGLSFMPKGTIILSSRAPIGKTAILGCEMCCNQGFKNLICSDAIYNEYLFYFLKCNTEYLNSLGRGATFKEISKSIVEDIDIPLPDYEEQISIAHRIHKIHTLISLRKQQLAKLDELVKARFVELFGDCENQEGLGNVATFIKTGKLDANAAVKDGDYPFFTCDSVPKRINKHAFDMEAILISGNGSQVGHIHYYNGKFNAYQRTYVLGNFLPTFDVGFIKIYLEMELKPYIMKNKKGSAVPYITLPMLQDFLVPKPPLSEQQAFSSFVEQTDKSKSAIQQSLDKLETLKKALMQKYFG